MSAVDEQILQLQKIREHRIVDFTAAQEAFAARRVEDLQLKAQMIANSAAPAAPQVDVSVGYSSLTAMVDLHRHHDVDEVDIPPCPSTMVASEVNAMASLWHFYHAVGPFAVAITFEALQVCPSFAHTLVGNSTWEGYWKEAANDVKGSQYIPVTLHNILKHVLHAKHVELAAIATAKETGLARYTAAKALAAQRRLDTDPF